MTKRKLFHKSSPKKLLSEFNLKILVQVPSLTVSIAALYQSHAREFRTLLNLAHKKHFKFTERIAKQTLCAPSKTLAIKKAAKFCAKIY